MNFQEPNSFQTIEEFLSGSVLLLDKPYRWTSFDVMGKIKAYVRHHIEIPKNEQGAQPKFKIGHAGTLDPLATGLLVVCTGKYTKILDQIQSGIKEYTGTIYFGQTTPSCDLETEAEGNYPTEHITEQLAKEIANSFMGVQLQTPPIFSAKQVNGQRAYKAARRGEHVDIPPVSIEVYDFQITRFEMPEIDFLIRCSKGTYIRSIARDFGERMNSGSYLKALRRTESSPFRIEKSMSPEALLDRLKQLNPSEK